MPTPRCHLSSGVIGLHWSPVRYIAWTLKLLDFIISPTETGTAYEHAPLPYVGVSFDFSVGVRLTSPDLVYNFHDST